MRPFRQLALDRRSFLRGSACAMALPWLDAMQPALRAAPPAPVRCVYIFSPNGVNLREWRPVGEGLTAKFGPTLQPLEPMRQRVTVWGQLAIDGGRPHGDSVGDHARAGASFLTCAHPRKTGGADIAAGVSVDQRIAAEVGGATSFASLELGMEKGAAAGVCDSGYSCAYSNNISWRSPNTPVPKETDPRAVFTRLFGDPEASGNTVAERQRRRREQSILDVVAADARSLAGRLGRTDQQKLDQYLQSVRELEVRLDKIEAEAAQHVAVPDGLLESGQGDAEHLALMYELIVLALVTDRTRVVTLMLGNAGSYRTYKFLGVPDGHHDLSHHGKKPEKLAALAKIDRFQIEQLARFLSLMSSRTEGSTDLLAQSLVVFGSGIGDGDRHNHDDLPVLLAGEGGGVAKALGHVRLDRETPMANLYLATMRAMGLADERFADSTGVLAIR
jgi:hypothetical protein